MVITAVNAGDDGATERSLDAFFRSLPGALDGFFRAALAFGSIWGIGLVLAAALVARRFRLAAVLRSGGLAAWWLGAVPRLPGRGPERGLGVRRRVQQ